MTEKIIIKHVTVLTKCYKGNAIYGDATINYYLKDDELITLEELDKADYEYEIVEQVIDKR